MPLHGVFCHQVLRIVCCKEREHLNADVYRIYSVLKVVTSWYC